MRFILGSVTLCAFCAFFAGLFLAVHNTQPLYLWVSIVSVGMGHSAMMRAGWME